MTNQSENLKAQPSFNKAGRLTVNCSESVSVFFNREALRGSVTSDLHARILNYLANSSGNFNVQEKIAAVLGICGITETGGNNFAVTNLINNLLDDGRGNQLVAVVMREHRRGGLPLAENRIAAWQRFVNSTRRELTETLADRLHEQLDTVKTVGNRHDCLVEINNSVRRLLQVSELQAQAATNRLEAINQRLQAGRNSQRNAEAQPNEATSRWNKMRGLFSAGLHYVNERIQTASNNAANSAAPSSQNLTESLEREALSAQIKVAALGTEREVLNALIELISQYIQAESETSAFLTAAAQESNNSARAFETTRNYGFAAGEVLLNGERLTTAATKYIFGEESDANFAAFVLANYLKDKSEAEILSELARTELSEMNRIVEQLKTVCGKLVEEKTEVFTITDALAALLTHGQSDIKNKLIEVFKATASFDFLSSRYKGFLGLKTYAAVSLAFSRFNESNRLIEDLLSDIKKIIRLRFDTKSNRHDSERLLFYCEFFNVPLDAFRFYDNYAKEFDKIKDQPRYNPHPDIHR
ncbi:MAG TPA: hypothetical protein VK308_15900 [Pyrinomonadaceae bacterium]|nr:hypothetical protein [Pyrinomonadaceae bacterium]